MTCAQCGGDEGTCGCTTHGSLLDFLSDFRGRERPVSASVSIPTEPAAASSPAPLPPVGFTPSPVPRPDPSPPSGRVPPQPRPPEAPAKEETPARLSLDAVSGEIAKVKEWASALPSLSKLKSHPQVKSFSEKESLSRMWTKIRSLSWEDNPTANAAAVLGLTSLYLPILAIPSVVLAIITLRRLPLQPWRQGKARAITGIVASVILAPISVFIWMSFL